jgi:methionyl-tRNA formyltransferase
MVYLFCAYRSWALELYEKLSEKNDDLILLKNPKKLTYRFVQKINPELIFFPDWSWLIPEKIVNNFKCVCIHESNLPKFRGGSPIQNQIISGIKKTKSTAFLMNEKLDSGPILLQKSLSLVGTINEIFERMIENDYFIIQKIINKKFKLRPQTGKSSLYKRRTPEQSELKHLNYPKTYLYNFIRMLDSPYPNAFIKIGKRKVIFKNANYDGKKLSCKVEIN